MLRGGDDLRDVLRADRVRAACLRDFARRRDREGKTEMTLPEIDAVILKVLEKIREGKREER